MRVKVLLFAHLAEALETREMVIELEDGARVADALNLLCSEHDAIAQMHDRVAVAVDERYAGADTVLTDGCALALIPPVSGG